MNGILCGHEPLRDPNQCCGEMVHVSLVKYKLLLSKDSKNTNKISWVVTNHRMTRMSTEMNIFLTV